MNHILPTSSEIFEDDDILGDFCGFEFTLADAKYWPAIMEHLERCFFSDETLCRALKSTPQLLNQVIPLTATCLEIGWKYSIVCFDRSTGRIAGVRVAKKLSVNDEPLVKNFTFSDDGLKVATFLRNMNTAVDVFKQYDVSEFLDLILVSIDPIYRGRGLAAELIVRSLRLGKQSGLKAVKGVFTSIYTQKIAEKLRMETLFELEYKKYKVDGLVVFESTDPHESAKLMARKL